MSFLPDDPGRQALLLAQTVVLSLDPNQTQAGSLFVFCTNLSKHPPSQGIGYKYRSGG